MTDARRCAARAGCSSQLWRGVCGLWLWLGVVWRVRHVWVVGFAGCWWATGDDARQTAGLIQGTTLFVREQAHMLMLYLRETKDVIEMNLPILFCAIKILVKLSEDPLERAAPFFI